MNQITVQQLAEQFPLEVIHLPEYPGIINSVYCCDLLSLVMGRAPADSAWITVMGNINAVAVAVLADTACIIVAEGCEVDDAARAKAKEQDVALFRCTLPVFEIAKQIDAALQ